MCEKVRFLQIQSYWYIYVLCMYVYMHRYVRMYVFVYVHTWMHAFTYIHKICMYVISENINLKREMKKVPKQDEDNNYTL